jgi:hypothetical protein
VGAFGVFHLNVAYVAMAIHVCCKCMFELFQTYVASVLSECCSGHTHVASVSFKSFTCLDRHSMRARHGRLDRGSVRTSGR